MTSFEDVLRVYRLERIELQAWIDYRWVRPRATAEGYVFDEVDQARIALIRELREEFLLQRGYAGRRAVAARSALRDPARPEEHRRGDGWPAAAAARGDPRHHRCRRPATMKTPYRCLCAVRPTSGCGRGRPCPGSWRACRRQRIDALPAFRYGLDGAWGEVFAPAVDTQGTFADQRDESKELMNQSAPLMAGKKGLIMGVANDRSIAWAIAKAVHGHGGEVALTYQGEALKKRVAPLAQSIDCTIGPALRRRRRSQPRYRVRNAGRTVGAARLRRPRHRLLGQGAAEGPLRRDDGRELRHDHADLLLLVHRGAASAPSG